MGFQLIFRNLTTLKKLINQCVIICESNHLSGNDFVSPAVPDMSDITFGTPRSTATIVVPIL